MEFKGKHLYGLAGLAVGVVSLLFAAIYWLINQKVDTVVQASLAIGLLSLALFAWLEIDLIAKFLETRQAQYGATALAYTLMIFVLVGLVNYIFFSFDKLKYEWDLTASKENSLAPETLQVLTGLKEPVKIIGFYTSTSYGRQSGEELLKRFRDKSNGTVGYELVDPQTQPVLARQYGIIADGTLVVTKGTLHENAESATESELVNAIVRIENPIQLSVYFITGHGELSPDDSGDKGYSQTKTYLENINYQIKTLGTLANAVPVDASVMVVAGPTKAYSQQDVDNLAKYLAGGGKAIFMLEPSLLTDLTPGQVDPLVDYLTKNWGLTLRDDVVLDPQSFVPGTDPTFPAAASYAQSPIITPEIETVSSFYPTARSIEVLDPAPEGVTTTSVVLTSSAAWGESNLEALKGTADQKVEPNAEDAQGELTLLATGENNTTKARVVVVGDAEFGVNGYWSSQAANPIVFLNAVKWTTEQENLISLSPKPITDTSMTVTQSGLIVIFLLGCLLPPVLIIIAATSVWWSRRRQNG